MRKRVKYFAVMCFLVFLIAAMVSAVYSAESRTSGAKEGSARAVAGTSAKGLHDRGDDVKSEIHAIDALLDQCVELKEAKDISWKVKAKEAGSRIKAIKLRSLGDADFYLIWARYSWIVDTRRESNITKALEKAFYFRPNYTRGYIVKGDIYSGLAMDADDTGAQQNTGSITSSQSSNPRFAYGETAKTSYKAALAKADIDTLSKAYVYYRMGELESRVLGDKEEAKADLQQAAALAPDSKWGSLAGKLLNKK